MSKTLDYLQGLFDSSQATELELNGMCHDCNKPVQVVFFLNEKGELRVEGGSIWKIEGFTKLFFKCEPCFEKEPRLTNYQPCEVFSRVCGYLRPVKQFNPGKKAEFIKRTNFKV